MSTPSVESVAAAPPAQNIAEVIERMTDILAVLSSDDGVSRFTWMYLQVTNAVQAAMPGQTFEDRAYLERLDVVFANLFLSAFAASVRDPAAIPNAWRPLFGARSHPHVLPLQFALAGMNAHINRDLPVALVTTARERNFDLADPSVQHDDYEVVNRLLAQTEPAVREAMLTGPLAVAADTLSRLCDRTAMWDIERARDAAWVQGETMWAIRSVHLLQQRYVDTLDHTVGFAGRGLLLPVL